MTGSDDKARLQDLASRVEAAKREAGLLGTPKAPVAGRGMQAGVSLVASVLVCTGLGVMLDRWLGTAPWFLLAMLVLGFVAGMWSAYRASQGVSELEVGWRKRK